MTTKNYMWLVGYCYNQEGDYFDILLFVTADEEQAKAYVKKFKRVQTMYQNHVQKYTGLYDQGMFDSIPFYKKIEIR
jgi:hypothetical protein